MFGFDEVWGCAIVRFFLFAIKIKIRLCKDSIEFGTDIADCSLEIYK